MKRVPILFAVMAMVLVLFSACLTDEEEPAGTGDVVRVGDLLPDFTAVLADGREVSPASLAGRPAVVVLFHTGCADCRRELPKLQALYAAYGSRVGFVCISREEGAESVAAYWQAQGFTLPYCACPDRSLYALFATHTIPRVYVADQAGRIRSQYTETVDQSRLQADLEQLLTSEESHPET